MEQIKYLPDLKLNSLGSKIAPFNNVLTEKNLRKEVPKLYGICIYIIFQFKL